MRTIYPFALLLGVWWLLSATGNPFVTPSPPDVLDRVEVAEAAPVTFGRVLLAYGLALVVGVFVGTAIGVVRPVRASVRPLVSFLFPVPKIALYPALLIIFGLGSGSKVALGFLEAVFPILLATAAGTSQVAPQLRWSAAALGAPSPFAIVIPAALPAILTGARIGLFGAIIGVFLGEMVAGADGLGHVMAVGYRTLDTPAMYVAIIVVSLAGFLLDRAFLFTRGRLLAWSVEE